MPRTPGGIFGARIRLRILVTYKYASPMFGTVVTSHSRVVLVVALLEKKVIEIKARLCLQERG